MSVVPLSAFKGRKEILEAIERVGLTATAHPLAIEAISGGVSSDVWIVRGVGKGGSIVAKRALPRLRVEQEWLVDTGRTRIEALWTTMAARHFPGRVPLPLGFDAETGILFLDYLAPPAYRQWREVLLSGEVDTDFAAQVGQAVAHFHAASISNPEDRAGFDDKTIFRQTRIDPYFDTLARAHPDVRDHIVETAAVLLQSRAAIIHGDISPKNILVGPEGPVFLDAECACLSDPAFDLPFCLAQMLLKELIPAAEPGRLSDAAQACASAYLDRASWEPVGPLEARMVKLLAIFMLGRVDGKVPVPYLRTDQQRAIVRRFASAALWSRPLSLAGMIGNWKSCMLQKHSQIAAAGG